MEQGTISSRSAANEESAVGRKDARAEKADAEYAVVNKKRDPYAGAAKDKCLDQAKAEFGKAQASVDREPWVFHSDPLLTTNN